ncbi:MAG: UvrD-helicase domain-containing protein [Proteobacteria bacterium]|nr:UvrD-helicase domain-containing protein [Pseudomonadota bacterium]
MQSESNKLIIASAGSGKTTYLVEEALSHSDRKTAILTYTNNNINEIKKKFCEKNGGISRGVDVATWYTFLLHECARPYQRSVYLKRRVKTIHYPEGRSAKGTPYSETERYYFRHGDEIYADKISRFVIDCEENSNGLVTKRLANIYDEVLIDEFQDLSGYDLDLLEVFLRAGIRMVIVGDPRQCTYTTNNSAKNSQYRCMGILKLAHKWEKDNLCQIENLARSYRCNQIICDYADSLWPGMEKTVSHNNNATKHDGIFVVSTGNVHDYVNSFSPVLLRYDRRAETYGYHALNFGNAKGLEFDRVLIIPHGPIRKYLQSGDVNDVKGSLEKFYVAVTRAKQSVAFLYDGQCGSRYIKWYPRG